MKKSLLIRDGVKIVFEDLGMYGEYYGILIFLDNGTQFEQRIEEHQFFQLVKQAELPKDAVNDLLPLSFKSSYWQR